MISNLLHHVSYVNIQLFIDVTELHDASALFQLNHNHITLVVDYIIINTFTLFTDISQKNIYEDILKFTAH